MMADDVKNVGEVLDRLEQLATENGKVELGAAAEAMGHRTYGPFLLIPALIDISPVGGIPGLPTLLAAVIVLVAVQMLVGRKHLWLPAVLARRALSRDKTCKTTIKARGVARFLDRAFHGRLPALTRAPMVRVAAVLCILLALSVPPLEIVPFATTAPMAAIAAFGLAMLVRDGLLMLVAMGLSLAALGLGLSLVGGGGGG
jgi:hypothetical protein